MFAFPGAKSAFLDIVSDAKSLDEFTPETILHYDGWINEMECSPNGRYIAVCSFYSSPIMIWETIEGKDNNKNAIDSSKSTYLLENELYTLPGMEFSADSNYLLIYSNQYNQSTQEYNNSRLVLYNTDNKTAIRNHEMKNNLILSATFSPDGTLYASSYEANYDSEKCSINLWDTNTGEVIESITSENHEVKSLAFTQDGKYLAVSYDNWKLFSDSIVFFDVSTGNIYKTLDGISAYELQFANDGSVLAGDNGNGKGVLVLDTNNYEVIAKFTDIPQPIDISLSPDGEFLMAVDRSTLIIWDIPAKKQILRTKTKNLDYADRFYTAKFSADGQQILIGLKVSEDSIYLMNSRGYSGRIFAYNFTEIMEKYDQEH
jgi:WD40 repeat protein